MATYYVSSSASGGGAGTSEGDPLAYAEAQALTLADDDHVFIRADGIYTTSARWLVGSGLRVKIEGYEEVPGDEGIAEIQVTSGVISEVIYTEGHGAAIRNLRTRVNGGVVTGNSLRNNGSGNSIVNCDVDGSIYLNNNAQGALMRCLLANGNLSPGFRAYVYGCSFFNPSVMDIRHSHFSNVAVFKASGTAMEGAVNESYAISDSVIVAGGTAVSCSLQRHSTHENLIVIGAATGFSVPAANVAQFRNIYFYDVSTQFSNTPSLAQNIVTLTDNPFIDAENGDLRLTAYGKSIPQLRAIMAGLVNVPGITTDPLEDLIGGGVSPALLNRVAAMGGQVVRRTP